MKIAIEIVMRQLEFTVVGFYPKVDLCFEYTDYDPFYSYDYV